MKFDNGLTKPGRNFTATSSARKITPTGKEFGEAKVHGFIFHPAPTRTFPSPRRTARVRTGRQLRHTSRDGRT